MLLLIIRIVFQLSFLVMIFTIVFSVLLIFASGSKYQDPENRKEALTLVPQGHENLFKQLALKPECFQCNTQQIKL